MGRNYVELDSCNIMTDDYRFQENGLVRLATAVPYEKKSFSRTIKKNLNLRTTPKITREILERW